MRYNSSVKADAPSPRTVLIVDDDPIALAVLAHHLRSRHGLAVQTATDGHEAWRTLESSGDDISLLICDLNMPECDGIELIEKLCSRRPRMPVLFVTGARPTITASAMLLANAWGLKVLGAMAKPANMAKLSEIVAAWYSAAEEMSEH